MCRQPKHIMSVKVASPRPVVGLPGHGKPRSHRWRTRLEKLLFAILTCVFLWWAYQQIQLRGMAFQTDAAHDATNDATNDAANAYVRLHGDFKHVSRDRVMTMAKAGIREGVSHTGLRMLDAELQSMPWIREVSIERVWPGGANMISLDRIWPQGVNIRVFEHRAAAYWGEGALLSERGKVFAPSPMPDAATNDWPVLYSENIARAGYLLALHHTLDGIVSRGESGGMRVTALREDKYLSKEMWLDNLTHVVLGNKDIESRVRRMVAVYGALAMRTIEYMDLRYPTGIAVRYQKGGADER